jgi:uncharacterized RDD family membrane protein YckC
MSEISEKDIYAGFWLRLFAWIIDKIFLIGVNFVVVLFFGLISGIISGIIGLDLVFLFQSNEFKIFLIIIDIGIAWAYYTLMESSSKQATLGKMILNLKVTDLEKKPISFEQASARFLGKILSVMTLGIGFLMIAFTEKKQGLHDILAGCLVIKE